MNRAAYTLLLRLLLPLALLGMWRQNRRTPAFPIDLGERLGRARTPAPGGTRPLWVHAVSVGEVRSAAGLLRGLRERFPALPVVLTTATGTGIEQARRLYPDVTACFAPVDLPRALRRFLDHHRPVACVIVETELWPNLIHAATARGMPVAMASARLSDRSVALYQRWAPRLVRATLGRLACVAAQSPADATRFAALGVTAQRIHVTGSLKLDFPVPADVAARGAALRARYHPRRPAWVAGSTHPVEEAQCLAAHRALLAAWPVAAGRPPLLVLVPRHPERFGSVASWLAAEGVRFARHSQAGDEDGTAADADVLLVDTLGELLSFYAASDAAFVGGSLVPVGGHNLLEPAALGVPVLTGPHTFNAPDAAQLLSARDALLRVSDAGTLAATLRRVLEDGTEARRLGRAALAAVEENRGAAARTIGLLAPLLPPG